MPKKIELVQVSGQKQSSRGVKKVFIEISQNSQENTCAREK